MGGVGSGRTSGFGKRLVEDYRCIDIRTWQKNGLKKPGRGFQSIWSDANGKRVGSINVSVKESAVVLSYSYRTRSVEPWQNVEQEIPLDWTRCHYGGERPWFLCPGWVNGKRCQRRVAKLHAAGKYFLCRKCHQLGYRSQVECRSHRLVRKAQKIREKLGGSANLLVPFPPKPKGMHHKTYWKLRIEAEHASSAGLLIIAERFSITEES